MKTGTYTIEFGDTFTETLTKTNGSTLFGESFQSSIEAYLYDNPQVFYLDANKMNINIEKITVGSNVTYNVYLNPGENSTYLSDGFTNKSSINIAIAALEEIRDEVISQKVNSQYYTVKMVHDYLIDNTEYDQTLENDNIYNIYGTLINGSSVCEGYAKAFKYILDEIGIECIFVFGDAIDNAGEAESHAWNYVKMDNNWYAVDVTWDDPIIIGGGSSNDTLKYKYFLKGENTFSGNHYPDSSSQTRSLVFVYPTLYLEDYYI